MTLPHATLATVTAWHAGMHVRSTITFLCPTCQERVTREISGGHAQQLHRAGATVVVHRVPTEALERHAGPPVGWDDVLDLRLALAALPDAAEEAQQ